VALFFDKSVDKRALEVKDVLQFVLAARLESVLHHHQPHFLQSFDFDGEHSVDARQQTVLVLQVVLLKSRQQPEEEIHLANCHSFDDDSVVMREEKEGSTATCSFSSSEDAVTVESGAQTSPHGQTHLLGDFFREH